MVKRENERKSTKERVSYHFKRKKMQQKYSERRETGEGGLKEEPK